MTDEGTRGQVEIRRGIPESCRKQAAKLYYAAFERKLSFALRPSGAEVFVDDIDLEMALAALLNNRLIGLAGFQQGDRTFFNVRFVTLARTVGWLKAAVRFGALALLDRSARRGELVMDGIVVDEAARGRGVGSALFDALFELAREQNCETIRLDVVDTNPRARQLYLRLGFEVEREEHAPYLKKLMGFSGAAVMIKRLDPA